MTRVALAAAASCLVLTSFALPALAADLPYRSRPDFAPPLVPRAFTWTGFYVGVNAGANVNGGSAAQLRGNDPVLQTNTLAGLRPASSSIRDSAFAGGQVGYNYQFSPFGSFSGAAVVGGEADIAYTGTSGSATFFSDRESILHSRTDYVGTVRGRLGYAFDTVLLYGTGGFAYGGTSNNTSFLNPAGFQTYNGNSSSTRTGYAVGGGVEFALPSQPMVQLSHGGAITLRVEYLRYELGSSSYVVSNNFGLDPGYTQSVRNNGNLVRAGLNYKFETFAPAVPVVARY